MRTTINLNLDTHMKSIMTGALIQGRGSRINTATLHHGSTYCQRFRAEPNAIFIDVLIRCIDVVKYKLIDS